MNIDFELKNHLVCEFLRRKIAPSLLSEERGVVGGIDEVVDAFMKAFREQIEGTFKSDEIIQTYKNPKILGGINTFFKSFNIELLTRKSNKTTYNGGTEPSSIKYDDGKKMWVCVPNIRLSIGAPNVNKLVNTLSFALSHELTHCFNLLQYAKKTEQDPFVSLERNRYFVINKSLWNGFGNEKAFANILYCLNRLERNAYLAQLRQELMSVKDKMVNDKAIFSLIRNSQSYSKFKYLESQINIICNEITDKETQDNIIGYVNKMMGKKFTNFNQIKKYFVNRWNKWKKAYLSKATKIAYDVYETTKHSKWLDWGIYGKDDAVINP